VSRKRVIARGNSLAIEYRRRPIETMSELFWMFTATTAIQLRDRADRRM